MPDYKKLYYALFNDITNIIEELKKIQVDSEERYLAMTDDETGGERD